MIYFQLKRSWDAKKNKTFLATNQRESARIRNREEKQE